MPQPCKSEYLESAKLNIMSETGNLLKRDGIQWKVGAFLEALDAWNNWCSAKIIDLEPATQKVLVHFHKWSQRYDTWYPMSSPCLRSLSNTSESTLTVNTVDNSVPENKSQVIHKKKTLLPEGKNTPGLSKKTSRSSVTAQSSQSVQLPHKKGDYVLSKWRNQLSYVATVADCKQRGNHGTMFYQVQYLCDGVLEWVPASRLSGCSKDEAMALMNTVPGASPPVQDKSKEAELMYDRTTKRFTDRCRDRRRRQRESLEGSLNASNSEMATHRPAQKRRRTDSNMSILSQSSVMTGGCASTIGSPLSSINAGLSLSQDSTTLSDKVAPVKDHPPSDRESDSIVSEEQQQQQQDVDLATVDTNKKMVDIISSSDDKPPENSAHSPLPKCIIPNPKLRVNMPASSALLSRCTLSYVGTRPKHKWRGGNSTVKSTEIKDPIKSPLKRTNNLSLSMKATTVNNTDSQPSFSNPVNSPTTPSSLPTVLPLSPPHSAGVISATSSHGPVVNLLRSSSVVQQACGTGVLQYACPYCKEKQEERIFRKESLLKAHIKIYHSSQQENKSLSSNKRCNNTTSSHYSSSFNKNKRSSSVKFGKSNQEKKIDRKFGIPSHDKPKSNLKDTSSTEVAVSSDTSKSLQVAPPDTSSGFSIVHCDRCGSCQEYDTMIQCDVCFIWAHMQCYGLNEDEEPPSYWECDACAGLNRPYRASRSCSWRNDWIKTGVFPNSSRPTRHDSSHIESKFSAESSGVNTRLVKEAAGVLCLVKSLSRVSWSLNQQLAEWRSGLLPPPVPASQAAGGQSQDNTDFDLLQLSLNDDELPHLLEVEATFGAQVGGASGNNAGSDPYGSAGLDDIAELTNQASVWSQHINSEGGGGVAPSCTTSQTNNPVCTSVDSIIHPGTIPGDDQVVFDLAPSEVLFPVSSDSGLPPPNSESGLLSFSAGDIEQSSVSKSMAGEMFSNIPADQLHTSGDLLDTIQQLEDLPDYLATVVESDTSIHVLPSTCPLNTNVATVDSAMSGSICAYPAAGHTLDAVSSSVQSLIPSGSSTRHVVPTPTILDKELLEYQQDLANQKTLLSNWFDKLAQLECVLEKADERIDKLQKRKQQSASMKDKDDDDDSLQIEIDKVRKNLSLTLMKLRGDSTKPPPPTKFAVKPGNKIKKNTNLKVWQS